VAAYIATFTGDRIVDRLGDDEELGTSPIKSIEDLGAQKQVKYGVVRGGSTYQFFRVSFKAGVVSERPALLPYSSSLPVIHRDPGIVFIGKCLQVCSGRKGTWGVPKRDSNEYGTVRN